MTFLKHLIIVFRGPLILMGALILIRFAINATVGPMQFTMFTIVGNGIVDLLGWLNFGWAVLIAIRGGFHQAHKEMVENKKNKK